MGLQFMKMQILEIGLLVLAAYLGGRIARKFNIGEVVGQILGGIIVGPHFLELIHRILMRHTSLKNFQFLKPIYHFYNTQFNQYANILEFFHFFVFLFLGLVAFSLGEELHINRLKRVGKNAFFICLIQALFTWIILTFGFYFIFNFSFINSALIASMGIATAPALTFILMSKLKIEGTLKNILANIVVLDDVIEVIFFSIFLGIAVMKEKGISISTSHLFLDLGKEFLGAIFIGLLIFYILKLMVRYTPEEEESFFDENHGFLSTVLSEHPTPSIEILFIIIGVISIGISIAIHFNLPFLITAVTAGFLISNFHTNEIFDSLKIKDVMPIFNLLFFAIIGASVRIESFSKDTIWFVLGYLILRTIGKLLGNKIGCKITNQDPKITASLPKLMLPQAGMAAVETILVSKLLINSGGLLIFNTVIPALVIFELVGAYISEKTLIKWKNWITGEKEALKAKGIIEDGYRFSQLVKNRIITLFSATKEEAIFEMALFLKKEGIVYDPLDIVNPVKERECLASTAIGNGVAIPHCRSEFVKQVTVVCAIVNHPIDWDAPDKKPVDLIFLIISPNEHPEEHLKAVKTISILLQKTNFYKDIRRKEIIENMDFYLKNMEETL